MDMYSPVSTVDDNFISNLESTFSKSFHIQDAQKLEHASEGDDYCDVVEGNCCEGIIQLEPKLDEECFRNCATLTYPDIMLPPSSSDAEGDISLTESLSEQFEAQPYSCSASLPTHLKLVSALKGGREKQEGSRMKLTVKWAPDVYDPVPTSVSHSVKSKKQHKWRNKKSEKKNGKKGTYSGGVSGKDKKQFRRSTGISDKWYKSPDSRNKVNESSTDLDAFDASQDSFCGTSFFKKSVAQAHFSAAEAQ